MYKQILALLDHLTEREARQLLIDVQNLVADHEALNAKLNSLRDDILKKLKGE